MATLGLLKLFVALEVSRSLTVEFTSDVIAAVIDRLDHALKFFVFATHQIFGARHQEASFERVTLVEEIHDKV